MLKIFVELLDNGLIINMCIYLFVSLIIMFFFLDCFFIILYKVNCFFDFNLWFYKYKSLLK